MLSTVMKAAWILVPVLAFPTVQSAQETAATSEASGRRAGSPEVKQLVDAYEREKARVLAPLNSNFDRALSDLKASYVKAGNLNGALAVDAFIKKRATREKEAEEGDDASEKPEDTRWKWGSGGELVIYANGTARHSSWERAGIWERRPDGSLEMLSQTGLHVIEFLADGTAIVKGKVRDTTLTPIE